MTLHSRTWLAKAISVFVALLWAVLAVGPLQATEELPDELKQDLTRIEGRLKQLDQQIGRVGKDRADQSLREVNQWIEEFALDAELLDDDPLLVKLQKQTKQLTEKLARSPDPALAKMEDKSSVKLPAREELDAMVKAPVDLNNISFKKDVAPIIANVCVGCHNPTRQSGKFDASTYESFVTMLAPGDPENSHLLDLVTGKAEPKMPRGNQSRFTKEWADIWTAWIRQGAKFDGPDKKAPLASYMIDLESQRREAFRKLGTPELERLHRGHAKRQVEIVHPKKPVSFRETPHFLVYTTLGDDDTEYVAVLAEALLEDLLPRFKVSEGDNVFRGRLGLTVFADRFDYVAFAREIDGYTPEPTEFGHYRAKPEHHYVAMTTQVDGMSLDAAVAQQVVEAFIRELEEGKAPDWAVYGFARVEAARQESKGNLTRQELQQAAQWARNGKSVQSLFSQDSPWVQAAPLSVSFFEFLQQTEKAGRTAAFVKSLARTGNATKAAKDVLNSSPEDVAAAWQAWAQSSKSGGGKKKGASRRESLESSE